jgi:hypothetical protein
MAGRSASETDPATSRPRQARFADLVALMDQAASTARPMTVVPPSRTGFRLDPTNNIELSRKKS